MAVPQNAPVHLGVDARVVAVRRRGLDAEPLGHVSELLPSSTNEMRRRARHVTLVARLGHLARSGGLHLLADRARRDRDEEKRLRAREERFDGVVHRPRQLAQPIADERRLADEHVTGFGVCAVPLAHRTADPEAHRHADRRMGESIDLGIPREDLRTIEGKARDIPLEQVDLARLLGRDERELLNDEALAHSGQTGHEDAAALARRFDEHLVEVRTAFDDELRHEGGVYEPSLC